MLFTDNVLVDPILVIMILCFLKSKLKSLKSINDDFLMYHSWPRLSMYTIPFHDRINLLCKLLLQFLLCAPEANLKPKPFSIGVFKYSFHGKNQALIISFFFF